MLTLFTAKLAGAVRSKTVWFNAVLLAMLEYLPTLLNQLDAVLPQLQPYLGADTYKHVTLFMVLGNLYLRFHTKLPLEGK